MRIDEKCYKPFPPFPELGLRLHVQSTPKGRRLHKGINTSGGEASLGTMSKAGCFLFLAMDPDRVRIPNASYKGNEVLLLDSCHLPQVTFHVRWWAECPPQNVT